jgi:hypothetical protein
MIGNDLSGYGGTRDETIQEAILAGVFMLCCLHGIIQCLCPKYRLKRFFIPSGSHRRRQP